MNQAAEEFTHTYLFFGSKGHMFWIGLLKFLISVPNSFPRGPACIRISEINSTDKDVGTLGILGKFKTCVCVSVFVPSSLFFFFFCY